MKIPSFQEASSYLPPLHPYHPHHFCCTHIHSPHSAAVPSTFLVFNTSDSCFAASLTHLGHACPIVYLANTYLASKTPFWHSFYQEGFPSAPRLGEMPPTPGLSTLLPVSFISASPTHCEHQGLGWAQAPSSWYPWLLGPSTQEVLWGTDWGCRSSV